MISEKINDLFNTYTFTDDKTIVLKTVQYFESLSKSLNYENFEHALQIARIIDKEINFGLTSSLSSLIFYSIPKNEIQASKIEELFGKEINDIISGLSKIPELKTEKLPTQTENYIKLLLTLSKDVRTILVKLAERLYKLRTIQNYTAEEQKQIAEEISYLYAPIAHRLGLYKIKTEMEESSLKVMNYTLYRSIADKINQSKHLRDKYIAAFIDPIRNTLKSNEINCEIKGRPKSISSIWNKMRTQGVPFEEVYDLFAIRIIIDAPYETEKKECWHVYSLITDQYKTNPNRLRDWISAPKASGYESLHTTVLGPENKWVEVQIRSRRMDDIAEKGEAAHWKYKEKGKSGGNQESLIAQIREALENKSTPEEIERKKAKAELYSDEIFIFTPKGDLKRCEKGSTVLDFAFSIHTNIGSRCTGAIVNQKFVSLKHVLNNGDHVNILTAKNQKPASEWVNIAQNNQVKARIKRILKTYEFKWSQIGKEIVQQKLRSMDLPYNDINVNKLIKFFDCKEAIELYQKIGEGTIEPIKIKKAFAKEEEPVKQEQPELKEVYDHINPQKIKDDFLLIDNNLDTIDYQFAKCCNPIQGDDIFAFVTVTKGTKIHRTDCPNAKDFKLKFPYRVVAAKWNKPAETSAFLATIRISGKHSVGIAGDITQVFSSEFKIKLRNITITERKGGMFDGFIVFYVSGKNQLDQVMTRLKTIKDILKISRVNSSSQG